MPLKWFKKAVEEPVPPTAYEAAASYLQETAAQIKEAADLGLDKFVENRFYFALASVVLFTVVTFVVSVRQQKAEAKKSQLASGQPTVIPSSVSVDVSEMTKLTADLTAVSGSSSNDDGSTSSEEANYDEIDDDQSVEETYADFLDKSVLSEGKIVVEAADVPKDLLLDATSSVSSDDAVTGPESNEKRRSLKKRLSATIMRTKSSSASVGSESKASLMKTLSGRFPKRK
jgi:hypothetical protein